MGKNNYCYPAIYDKEDKGYNLRFPDISEAYTCGDHKTELFKNAEEVLELSLRGRLKDGEVLPKASIVNNIKLKDNEELILVNVCI